MTSPEDKTQDAKTDPDAPTGPASHGATTVALAPDVPPLEPGQRLGDRYTVIRHLGKGGMGSVYLARDERLGREVALKLQARAQAAEVERLRREATALAQLSHPNVVVVYEVADFEGQIFIAMEYVEGWTLREWLDQAPRGVGDVVSVLVAAGRGLAAAHSAGLVHRDFKPANVLVGKDGRARVADFGLARRAFELPPSTGGRPGPVDTADAEGSLGTVTAAGGVVGTPAYMAPEQYRGAAFDARSDQFAYCLTLYQALVAGLPAREAVEKAAVPFEGAAGRRVPSWLRDVVRRGLRPDPQERFPDMDALLAVLEATPRRIRARRIAAATALGLLTLVGAAWWWWPSSRPACPPATHRLQGVWDAEMRQGVSRAFLGSQVPDAQASLDTVTARLDRYTADWVATQQRICEATRVHGEQSDQALDDRMACMNGLLGPVQALTAVLAKADATVVGHAREATATLIPIERCTGADARSFVNPVPKNAADMARIERAVNELNAIYVALIVGKSKEAKAALATLEQADLPEHTGLQARLGYVRAQEHWREGRREEAFAELEESAANAMKSGDDHMLFWNLVALAHFLGEADKPTEALRWLGFAEAVSARLGNPPAVAQELENTATVVYTHSADFASARDHGERCVALARSNKDQLTLARCLLALSLAQHEAGEYESARKTLSEALRLSARQVGYRHRTTINILENLAVYAAKAGDYAAAREHAQKAIEYQTALSGEDSTELAGLCEKLGAFAQEQGDLETARDYLERAYEINVSHLGEDHLEVGFSLGNRAIVSLLSGRPDEALALAERSHRIMEAKLGPRHPIMINAFVIEGTIHRERGDLDRSAASLEMAVEMARALLPKDHPAQVSPRTELAKTALAQDRLKKALSLTREVERLCAAGKVSPREIADNQLTMAKILWRIGDDRPQAVAVAREARAAFAKMELKQELADAEAWLQKNKLAN